MSTFTCTCGASYRLPEDSAGKRVRCKHCGETFTIPKEEAALPVAPLDDGDHGYFQKQNAGAGAPAASDGAHAPGSTAPAPYTDADELVARGRAAITRAAPPRSFWSDVGWTFLLFTDPGNLIALVMIWFVYAIIPVVAVLPCLGLICLCIIGGWICSYWFNIITEAADGEDSLPRMGMTSGVVEDIVFPLLKFVGATVVAATPVVACRLAAHWLDLPLSFAPPDPLAMIALGASIFLWPMVLLVVAIGGFEGLLRVDLMAATMARTFLPYSAVCLLVTATTALHMYAGTLASAALGGASGLMVTAVLSALLQAYFGVVSMRLVGLYYHHFKARFAWSWE